MVLKRNFLIGKSIFPATVSDSSHFNMELENNYTFRNKSTLWSLAFFIVTARKRSLRRLCFYRCLSVHRGGVCGCSQGGHAWLLAGGACVVAPRGHAWLLPGGCAWLLRGACMVAPGGACVVALGGHVWLLLGGVHGCSGGDVRGFFDEIQSMSRQYTSYWNAFFFIFDFSSAWVIH